MVRKRIPIDSVSASRDLDPLSRIQYAKFRSVLDVNLYECLQAGPRRERELRRSFGTPSFPPGRRGSKLFERTREQNSRPSLSMELQVKT